MITTNEAVKTANDFLEKNEPKSVQTYTTMSGFEATGYRPQYIVDAANLAFGASGWRHITKNTSIDVMPLKDGKTTTVATAEVSIQLLDDKGNVTFETGTQFGGSKVISGNVADGKKGAVTDAIGKALSILGIGSKAYRGDLDSKNAGKSDVNTKEESSTSTSGFTVTNDKAPTSTNRFKVTKTLAKTTPTTEKTEEVTSVFAPSVHTEVATPVGTTTVTVTSNGANGSAAKPTFKTGKFAKMLAESKGNA